MNDREHTVQVTSAKARLRDAINALNNFAKLNSQYAIDHKMITLADYMELDMVQELIERILGEM